MTDDPRQKLAQIAQAVERDIDEGTIRLTGAAADRELARLAEQKHAAAKLSDPCRHCAHTRYSHKHYDPSVHYACAEDAPDGSCGALHCACAGFELGTFGEQPGDLRGLVEGLLGKETPESRAALAAVERYFAPPGKLERGHYAGDTAFPTKREADALAFCFRIALEHDHGGAKRLRRLLYAWHNAAELGGFDFSDLWSLDEEYRAHALAVIGMIARSPQGWYAEHYGYAADMAAIVDTYGPRAVHS